MDIFNFESCTSDAKLQYSQISILNSLVINLMKSAHIQYNKWLLPLLKYVLSILRNRNLGREIISLKNMHFNRSSGPSIFRSRSNIIPANRGFTFRGERSSASARSGRFNAAKETTVIEFKRAWPWKTTNRVAIRYSRARRRHARPRCESVQ